MKNLDQIILLLRNIKAQLTERYGLENLAVFGSILAK